MHESPLLFSSCKYKNYSNFSQKVGAERKHNPKHMIFTAETWFVLVVEIDGSSEKAELMSMLLTSFNHTLSTPKIPGHHSCKVCSGSHKQLVILAFSFLVFCCMANFYFIVVSEPAELGLCIF